MKLDLIFSDELQRALQDPNDFFGPLSEEEQWNLDHWAKKEPLDKDVKGIRATDTTQIQNGLDEFD